MPDLFAYRLRIGYEDLLSDEAWSLEKFRELAVKEFMDSCEGFERPSGP